MTRTAFVTGGTGFVGLNLVQALMARDWNVVALHRPTSDLTFLKRFSPLLTEGSITDFASLMRAMPIAVDTVFHVAGDTNMWGRRNAEQTRNNVEGTRNVVEAALAKGARRLIVTSSISAYGPVSGAVTEETPSCAAESWVNYDRSKWHAQEIARAAVGRGLEVVILQPGAIMGPYDIGTFSRLFVLARDGKLPGVLPSGLTFTHVRETVKAHTAAADKGENGGQYLLGGENRSMLALMQEIARLIGKPVPTKELPAGLIRIIARIGDFSSGFTGKEPTITPELAETLCRVSTTTSAKAILELDYKIVPLSEMIQDCYDWMIAEKRI